VLPDLARENIKRKKEAKGEKEKTRK